MRTITITAEGPDARRALADFLAIPGVEGESQPVQPVRTRDGGALVAIGAVVAIAGGVAQVVTSIIDWRERWMKARETKRLSVVIEDGRGNRLALDRATPEQITAALRTLHPDS